MGQTMKIYIIVAIAAVTFALLVVFPRIAEAPFVEIATAAEPEVIAAMQPIVWDKPAILAEISAVAAKYSVSEKEMVAVVACETANTSDPNIQSRVRYKFDNARWGVKAGEQEKSFGLVAIHLPDHPNVTKEQATNVEFALNFLGENLAKGKGSMWTCWRNRFN